HSPYLLSFPTRRSSDLALFLNSPIYKNNKKYYTIKSYSNTNGKWGVTMKLKDLYFDDLEIITAITFQYQDDIETKLLDEKDEVLQEDVASLVYEIYEDYLKLSIKASLLDLVNKKHISIKQVDE